LKALVTGAAGFIGPHIVRRILADGNLVQAYDDLSAGALHNLATFIKTGAVEFIKGDIRDRNRLVEAAKNCEIIYHLAAQSSVPKSTEDPISDMEINIGGTLNVLEAARQSGSRVIFASSSVVYGKASRMPTPEEEKLEPWSFYGASKATAEVYCRLYSELFGVPTAILRLFNIYGPGTNKGVMIDLYRKLLRDPKRLELLGSGMQKKDYLYIDDAVEAFVLAAERSPCKGDAYNIGLGKSYTVFEIARMMVEELGLGNIEIFARGGTSWAGDVEVNLPSVVKAELEIGWKAKTELREGLIKTMKWFESQLGRIEGAKRLK